MVTVMSQPDERERFIPFSKADIVEMCAGDGRMGEGQRESFLAFCRILEGLFHFEFHAKLEALKAAYAPFNPDSDTRTIREYDSDERHTMQGRVVAGLTEVLDAANFERVTEADLAMAMEEESLFKIRLSVDFDDFEEVLFFRRGESTRRETLVKLFGLRKQDFEFTNYDRVAIYIKFKDMAYFEAKKRKDILFRPGSTIVKLFQDVPKADLEMLFPNTEVRMKTIDKVLMGVPAAVGGVVVLATKLFGTIVLIGSLIAFWLGLSSESVDIEQKHLIALAVGLAALGGFVFKQVTKFKNRKIRFMKTLSDNLYFKNLDNNAGVFHHLLDSAEEEECKEAILGYYFLLTATEDLTEEGIDQVIEAWFETNWDCSLDFEVDDALRKLERLKLVRRDGEVLRALSLQEAKRQLDSIWDNYFDFDAGIAAQD